MSRFVRARFVTAWLGVSVVFVAAPAFAGDVDASGPGHYQSPVIVVYGRPNRPNVQIVVKTPTAASAAGAAHEALRLSLMAKSEPAK
jgi:hypothetical protein